MHLFYAKYAIKYIYIYVLHINILQLYFYYAKTNLSYSDIVLRSN